MKIKERVAQNLKALTAAHGTAASVSRSIGINPMQFGRYLSGQQMPNDATMERICNFFGVEELDLVEAVDQQGKGFCNLLAKGRYQKPTSEALELARSHIEEGKYFFYLQTEKHPDLISRSSVAIKEENGAMTYRRITALGEQENLKFRNVAGDNHGLVMASRFHLHFASFDLHSSFSPNLLTGKWSTQVPGVITGYGVSLGPDGTVPVKFAAKKIKQPLSVSKFLRMSRVLSRSSNEIPRDIADALME